MQFQTALKKIKCDQEDVDRRKAKVHLLIS